MRRFRRLPMTLVVVTATIAIFVAVPASAAPRTLTFGPVVDTTIRADHPAKSYGSLTTLTADNSPVQNALLRFTVSGVGTDVVVGATLRLFVTNPSPVGGSVARVASQTWGENVPWNSAPVADPLPVATISKAAKNTWAQFNVLPIITGDGTYSMRISSTSIDGVAFVSREGANTAQRPQLVLTTSPPPDQTAPTVGITAPTEGANVSGSVAVDATASDNVGVTSVTFSVDGSPIGTDTTSPYEVPWDTSLVANGAHTVTASAVDAAGNTGDAAPIGVNVGNAVDTTSPDPPGDLQAAVGGPRQVSLTWAAAVDNVAVTGYEVSRDGSVLTTTDALGYVDTSIAPGTHATYSVVAIDPSANRSDPATVDATTPAVPTSFTFAAAGDHGANPTAALSLAALDASPASFYLALGDLDYDETTSDAAWCDYIHQHLPTKGPDFPFEVVTGNHEDDTMVDGYVLNHAACLPDHLGATAGPGSQYGVEYSFDYPAGAPLARFIMVSPELKVNGTTYHYVPGNPHYAWLKDAIDQAHAAGIPWVVVGMHYPCLSAGQYGCAAGSALMNLLVNEKVDLVLHGHEHSYQRGKQLATDPTTCPTISPTGYNPACVVDDGMDGVYPKGAGTVDVIDGTFGRSLYASSRADPEAPYFAQLDGTTHGFMRYDVTATKLDASFVHVDGTFNDAFSIVQGATPLADRSPPSTPNTLAADTTVPGKVTLSWGASTDDAGIRNYIVSRDGVAIGTTTTTSFVDPSVTSGGTYAYSVTAYDTAFNPSTPAGPLSVTIPTASTLTFIADADASLYAANPTTNYGATLKLEADNSPVKNFLVRFTVAGVGTSTVTGATLRLTCSDPAPRGGDVTLAASTPWTEGTVTWGNAPAAGATAASMGAVVAGTTYAVDLSSIIHGDGTYTLRITTPNADGADFVSREGAIGSRLQLTVTLAG
jgi:Big-like domain-containing protein/calcineurin-like phosphoesterase family protein